MSVFKSEHRDKRTFGAWLAGFFLGERCRSTLCPPHDIEQYHCQRRRGHKGRHIDRGMSWGYGDNWLEGN